MHVDMRMLAKCRLSKKMAKFIMELHCCVHVIAIAIGKKKNGAGMGCIASLKDAREFHFECD